MRNLESKTEENKVLLYDIAGVLKFSGYGIAETLSGKKVENPQPSFLGGYNSMGILVHAKPIIFGFPVPFLGSWAYPADLWIDNQVRGATPKECWVLDIYGRENIDNVKKLVEAIANPHKVRVVARVIIEDLRWEGQKLNWPELEKQSK